MDRWDRVEQRLMTEAGQWEAPESVQRELEEGERHPFDALLREDRIPHIWCSGCGLGTSLTCFLSALLQTDLDLNKVSIVSGIGCSGRIAGYVRLDSFHTTHGRAIPFATGLKLANPDLKVVVMSGDGDLIAIGGNHFIHAARRNLDIMVVCVNNLNYGMTGGQVAPTTPVAAKTSTSPYGNYEPPFNLPYLAAASGAVYVARWTTLQVRQLERSLIAALNKRGFSFVEIISPCPTLYGRGNRLGNGLDMMRYFRDKSVIQHGADPREADIYFGGPIIVGNFLDLDRPSYLEFRDWLWRESNYGKKREEVLKKLHGEEGERKPEAERPTNLARRHE